MGSVKVKVGYFLEDVGQERFLTSLVERVAQEKHFGKIEHEVRNATGGRGRVLSELRKFLRELGQSPLDLDLLVVAIDGNCKSYQKVRKEIHKMVQRSRCHIPVVCAIPDPHIERWYLADEEALKQVLNIQSVSSLPPYKCERGRYKRALRQTVQNVGIIPPLGGIEYGADIANTLDFYKVGKVDAGFKHFIDDLRTLLSNLKHFPSSGK